MFEKDMIWNFLSIMISRVQVLLFLSSILKCTWLVWSESPPPRHYFRVLLILFRHKLKILGSSRYPIGCLKVPILDSSLFLEPMMAFILFPFVDGDWKSGCDVEFRKESIIVFLLYKHFKITWVFFEKRKTLCLLLVCYINFRCHYLLSLKRLYWSVVWYHYEIRWEFNMATNSLNSFFAICKNIRNRFEFNLVFSDIDFLILIYFLFHQISWVKHAFFKRIGFVCHVDKSSGWFRLCLSLVIRHDFVLKFATGHKDHLSLRYSGRCIFVLTWWIRLIYFNELRSNFELTVPISD